MPRDSHADNTSLAPTRGSKPSITRWVWSLGARDAPRRNQSSSQPKNFSGGSRMKGLFNRGTGRTVEPQQRFGALVLCGASVTEGMRRCPNALRQASRTVPPFAPYSYGLNTVRNTTQLLRTCYGCRLTSSPARRVFHDESHQPRPCRLTGLFADALARHEMTRWKRPLHAKRNIANPKSVLATMQPLQESKKWQARNMCSLVCRPGTLTAKRAHPWVAG